MVVTQGRVVAVRDGVAEVQLAVKSACGACGAKSVCASGHERTVSLSAPEGVAPGDTLELAVPESRLNLGALVGYLLPAVATLGGALLLAPGGDEFAVLGAGAGLALGLWLVRRLGGRLLAPRLSPCSTPSTQGETP